MNTLSTQIGGNHYMRFKVQPVYFCLVNGLSCVHMNFIKYLLRDKSNKLEDLEKARHSLQMLKEHAVHITLPAVWNITPLCFCELNKLSKLEQHAFMFALTNSFDDAEAALDLLFKQALIKA